MSLIVLNLSRFSAFRHVLLIICLDFMNVMKRCFPFIVHFLDLSKAAFTYLHSLVPHFSSIWVSPPHTINLFSFSILAFPPYSQKARLTCKMDMFLSSGNFIWHLACQRWPCNAGIGQDPASYCTLLCIKIRLEGQDYQ